MNYLNLTDLLLNKVFIIDGNMNARMKIENIKQSLFLENTEFLKKEGKNMNLHLLK